MRLGRLPRARKPLIPCGYGAGAARPVRERHGRATLRNWRSITGRQRKSNARTGSPAAGRQLAFVYRDVAEMERQLTEADAADDRRAGSEALGRSSGGDGPG
jgi:hypothetical protein